MECSVMQSSHRGPHSSRLTMCTAFVMNTQQGQRSIHSSILLQVVLSTRTNTPQQSQRLLDDKRHCVPQLLIKSLHVHTCRCMSWTRSSKGGCLKGRTVDGVTEQRARHLPAAGRANLDAQRGRVHIHHRQLQRRNIGAQLRLRRLLLHQRAAKAIACTINEMSSRPTSSRNNSSCSFAAQRTPHPQQPPLSGVGAQLQCFKCCLLHQCAAGACTITKAASIAKEQSAFFGSCPLHLRGRPTLHGQRQRRHIGNRLRCWTSEPLRPSHA